LILFKKGKVYFGATKEFYRKELRTRGFGKKLSGLLQRRRFINLKRGPRGEETKDDRKTE
jgi:hypothetical protein